MDSSIITKNANKDPTPKIRTNRSCPSNVRIVSVPNIPKKIRTNEPVSVASNRESALF